MLENPMHSNAYSRAPAVRGVRAVPEREGGTLQQVHQPVVLVNVTLLRKGTGHPSIRFALRRHTQAGHH
jgi:hypothetical protein